MSYLFNSLPKPLQELYGFGILRDIDLYLAEALKRKFGGGKSSDESILACCLASRMVGQGHICFKLSDADVEMMVPMSAAFESDLNTESLTDGIRDLCARLAGADHEILIKESHGVIGCPESICPVVLSGGRLYLRRYWQYESLVAERLIKMSKVDKTGGKDKELTREIEGSTLKARQKDAAKEAMERHLTIISGGPGTGKTFTAAKILDLLLRYPPAGRKVPVIKMAAPTGKAAARLDESLRGIQAFNQNAIDPASTIDRLLGYVSDSPYFRHNKNNPLPADVILIDEASMVDLPKFAKLLDAMSADCRLILLGDMHQLASVDPGNVMADLCSSKSLKVCVTELNESVRFKQGSPVDILGKAVNLAVDEAGAESAWADLSGLVDPKYGDKKIIQRNMPQYLKGHNGLADKDFADSVIRGFEQFLKADTPAKAFEALLKFRILCALRKGPHGVKTVNGLVVDILSGKALKPGQFPEGFKDWHLKPGKEFYSHRVIMVTKNDYSLELFNGDVGVVMDDGSGKNKLVAWFEGRKKGDVPRKVQCRLLPEHETAFAITVHKSQGSEFDQVLVMLPYVDSPVLSKELLYTAITRTSGGVELWCNKDTFKECVVRKTKRFSGLKEALQAEKLRMDKES